MVVSAKPATLARNRAVRVVEHTDRWTGFIVFADAFVYRARGNSWIRSAPHEFVWLALASIPLWVVFEGFNLVLDNWYYSACPRTSGCGSSATPGRSRRSTPAIFEAAELFAVLRGASPTVESPARSRSGQPAQRGPSEFDRVRRGSSMDRARRDHADRAVRRFSPTSRVTWPLRSGSDSSFCSIRSTRASAPRRCRASA